MSNNFDKLILQFKEIIEKIKLGNDFEFEIKLLNINFKYQILPSSSDVLILETKDVSSMFNYFQNIKIYDYVLNKKNLEIRKKSNIEENIIMRFNFFYSIIKQKFEEEIKKIDKLNNVKLSKKMSDEDKCKVNLLLKNREKVVLEFNKLIKSINIKK